MNTRKLLAYFAAIVILANIFYPISSFANSDKANPSGEKRNEHAVSNDKNSDNENKNDNSDNGKPEKQEKSDIVYDAPDEGDNNHPSGKDRSVEPGKSQNQGKSQSDPDGMKNSYGGESGKDKNEFDGGLDKEDQDGNNGCGNDDDFEDDNNGNCGGKDKPDKNPKTGGPSEDTDDEDESNDDDDSSNTGGKVIVYNTNNNDQNITNKVNVDVTVNVNNDINSESKRENKGKILSASTLAATGDSMLRLGFTLLFAGIGSFALGLYFLGRKAYEKIFSSSYQTELYVYEA